MAKDFDRRLRRLEARFPASPEDSEFGALLPFMTLDERLRLLHGYQLGFAQDESFQRDMSIILEKAADRQNRRLNWCDMEELNNVESAKKTRLWNLLEAIRTRNPDFRLSTDSFDVLDLSSEEIDQLAHLVTCAAAPEDLSSAVQFVEKLRIDGRPLTLNDFSLAVFVAPLQSEPSRRG